MQIRVYYEDTDCGNVVYYANYLRYMERSRTEYLRERGNNLLEWQQQGVIFIVVEVQVQYRSPARYNDILDVESTVSELTSASVVFSTTIFRHKGPLLTKGIVRLACVNSEGHVQRIPATLREVLR
jgi:acyl-CoA thioester hydrolase